MKTQHAALALVLALSIADAGKTPPPPDPKKLLPKYTINLDLEPEKRFVQVVQDHRPYLREIVTILKGLFHAKPGKESTDAMVASFKKGLADEYAREIQGIATAGGVDYDDALMANLFYEINSIGGWMDKNPFLAQLGKACTSMAAQSSQGTMLLARNMDYPPPFGPLQIHATFVKGGKKMYEGTMFSGVIGIVTGMTTGGFAVSINARDNFSPTLETAQAALEKGSHLFHMIVRRALETVGADYDGALKFFEEQPMVSPGYITLAGVSQGQGAVVTTNTSALSNDVWQLKHGFGGKFGFGNWFLVETNSDHWKRPPLLDGRRDFAKKNMQAVGQDRMTLLHMWDVLSTGRTGLKIKVPVYNFATIQTDLACPATGEFRAYLRHCWDWSFSGACNMTEPSTSSDIGLLV